MIRFIPVDEVLPIRNQVLRQGLLTLDECRFEADQASGAFHLGYFLEDDQLVCIASFLTQNYPPMGQGQARQLRGMATLESHRGKGFGNQLLNFAIVYLRGQKINYLWCNARSRAVPFYLNMGFEIISEEFEVAGIGPHRVLYLKIQ